MRKILVLLTPVASLMLVSCALLPHGTVRLGTMSGPISVRLGDLPAKRSTQLIPPGGLEVEIRAYRASDPTHLQALGNALAYDWQTGLPIIATYSVSAGTSPNLTLPELPAGNWVLRAIVYDTGETFYAIPNGAIDQYAKYSTVGMGEATVSTSIGMAYGVTIPVNYTVPYLANLDDRVMGSATNSLSVTGVLPGSTGLRVRIANWNPYLMLATGSWDAVHHRVRLAVTVPRYYPINMASTSNSAGYWILGDISANTGFSGTMSFTCPAGTPGPDVWMWNADTTRNTIYTDIDLHGADASYYDKYTSATSVASGALTVVLPSTLAPTGYTLTMTDLASP